MTLLPPNPPPEPAHVPFIVTDPNGIDDMTLPDVNLRLERMDDGAYWLKVGPHVIWFRTRRNALIVTSYENEGRP